MDWSSPESRGGTRLGRGSSADVLDDKCQFAVVYFRAARKGDAFSAVFEDFIVSILKEDDLHTPAAGVAHGDITFRKAIFQGRQREGQRTDGLDTAGSGHGLGDRALPSRRCR